MLRVTSGFWAVGGLIQLFVQGYQSVILYSVSALWCVAWDLFTNKGGFSSIPDTVPFFLSKVR